MWGNSEHGYRDVSAADFIRKSCIVLCFLSNTCLKKLHLSLLPQTSVLCKSAVHAGATSDSLGGHITVNRGRSLTLYESTFANGVLSKMYVFVFHILNEILWKCVAASLV